MHPTQRSIARTAVAITFGIASAGCDSGATFAPSGGPRPSVDAAQGSRPGEAALIVGNAGQSPTDGILRYDSDGTFIDVMVRRGVAGQTGTCCMTYGPDENLYVSNPAVGSVRRHHGITGAFIDVFVPPGSGGLELAVYLRFHDGKLYVGDARAGAIRMYDAVSGRSLGDFVPPGDHGMIPFDPQDFRFGPDGNLYVASQATGRILRYDGTNGAFIDEVVPAGPDGVWASGFDFGPDGHLYASDTLTDGVRRYDIATKTLIDVFVAPGSGGMLTPVGTVFGPDGSLYVASADSREILRYNGQTGAFVDAFVAAGYGGLSGPRLIEFKTTMTLCHSRGLPSRTLTVGYMSAFDHVAHGDALGRCG